MVWSLPVIERGHNSYSGLHVNYLRPPEEDRDQLKPHELIEHIDLKAIAEDHDATLVRSIDELHALRLSRPELQRPNISGKVRGAIEYAMTLPDLLKIVLKQIKEELDQITDFTIEPSTGLKHVRGKVNGLRVASAPGWAAFNNHVEGGLDGVDVPRDKLAAYDGIALNRSVMNTAYSYVEGIIKDKIPTIFRGHSQGGLVSLIAATILERLGYSDLVAGLVLISPASFGPSPWLQKTIQHGGKMILPNLADMLKDSAAINFWQTNLSPEMRKRTVVIQYAGKGGDGITTAEESFVPGGSMFAMHKSYPHESAARDNRHPAAQLANTTIGIINEAYHRYSLAS